MVLVDGIGENLEEIGHPSRFQNGHPVFSAVKNFLLVVFFSSVVFTILNLPAYSKIIRYRLNPSQFAISAPPPVPRTKTEEPKPVKHYDENRLIIPKIGVEAPINWDVESGNIMDTLQNGLVHLKDTGKPEEGKNIFITGHSSNYWWRKGGYNTVFALLPQLEEDDEIFITYKSKIFKFAVFKKLEVKKKEAENYVKAEGEQLTLMTCVPVGTNLERLLVIAKPLKE